MEHRLRTAVNRQVLAVAEVANAAGQLNHRVLHGRRDEMAFHDNVGLRLALGNVALRHLAPLNDIRLRQVRLYRGRILCERCLDIKERCKRFIFDLHRFGSRTGSFLRFRSDDGHAVAEHQRLVSQHLFICHQQWGRRVARTVEIFLRRFLRQGTAEVAGDLLRLARINAKYLGVGMGAAHQRGIRHVRHRQIVCILPEAGRLVNGFQTRRLVVDNSKITLFHHARASFPFAYASIASDAATIACSIFV